jgi:hypothetical protein
MTTEINAAAKRYREGNYPNTSYGVQLRTSDAYTLADAMARQLTPIDVPTEEGWYLLDYTGEYEPVLVHACLEKFTAVGESCPLQVFESNSYVQWYGPIVVPESEVSDA